MTINDSAGFFGGSGATYFGFAQIGTTITGTITEDPETRQQTDPATGELKTWKGGDPMLVLVVTLQTTLRDPADPEDDGKRSVWISSAGQKTAVGRALKTAGVKQLDVGGTLTLTYSGDGEKTNPAFNAPKIFTSIYAPPSASAAFFNADTNGHTAAAAAVPAAKLPSGMTPAVWSTLTPEAQAALVSLGQ